MTAEVEQIKRLLQDARKVVIVTHQNPDGDAVGSSQGLWHYLQQLGLEVKVIYPTNVAAFYHWTPGFKDTLIYPYKKEHATRLIQEADIIFCLDFNALHRIDELGKLVEQSDAKKVVIDHHLQPDDFPDVLISDTSASSTAELVYDFIIEAGNADNYLNKAIADNLYTGLLTDTGSFQFPATTGKVHRTVAHLIDLGVEPNTVFEHIYNSFSEDRLRLFGYCITEKMRSFPEVKAAVISLDRDELKRFNVGTGDTEGLVNYPLKVSDIHFSALVIDRTELIKMSFRSKGDVDCNTFARKYFNGGGHRNAAGGASHDTLENTLRKLEKALPEYLQQYYSAS